MLRHQLYPLSFSLSLPLCGQLTARLPPLLSSDRGSPDGLHDRCSDGSYKWTLPCHTHPATPPAARHTASQSYGVTQPHSFSHTLSHSCTQSHGFTVTWRHTVTRRHTVDTFTVTRFQSHGVTLSHEITYHTSQSIMISRGYMTARIGHVGEWNFNHLPPTLRN